MNNPKRKWNYLESTNKNFKNAPHNWMNFVLFCKLFRYFLKCIEKIVKYNIEIIDLFKEKKNNILYFSRRLHVEYENGRFDIKDV